MTKRQLVAKLVKALEKDIIDIVSTDVPEEGEDVTVTRSYDTFKFVEKVKYFN